MFKNLRAEIARRGLSIEKFAAAVGMKKGTFSSKFRGNVDFTLPEALKIKNFLGGLPIEYLFEKDNATEVCDG